MSVKQSIKVTNAGLSPILSVAQGTGAIEYEFMVSDFDIPSGSAAVAYNIQPTGNIVSQTCSISGNTITVKPPAYFFLRGKNYMQFQVSRSNEDLFSFLIEVWCAPNISQPEVIVAENPSLVSQLISDVGLLSSQLDNLLSIPSGSLSTSADAALADIKTGFDGTIYDTPGDAVRGQTSLLSKKIQNVENKILDIYVNLFNINNISENAIPRKSSEYLLSSNVYLEGRYTSEIINVEEGAEYIIQIYEDEKLTDYQPNISLAFGGTDGYITDYVTSYKQGESFKVPEGSDRLRFTGSLSALDGRQYMLIKKCDNKKYYDYNIFFDVVKDNLSDEIYGIKGYVAKTSKCNRIINPGIFQDFALLKIGDNAEIFDNGNVFFSNRSKRVVCVNNEMPFVILPLTSNISKDNFKSLTLSFYTDKYFNSTDGEYSGYFIIYLSDNENAPIASENTYSNGRTTFGWNVVKFTSNDFTSIPDNITCIKIRFVARNTVGPGEKFGGVIFDSIILNQSMRPALLLNFDQWWDESINNGAYDYAFGKNIAFTMFTKNYDTLNEEYKALAEKTGTIYGWENSLYGAYGDSNNSIMSTNLNYNAAKENFELNKNALINTLGENPISYGCSLNKCPYTTFEALKDSGIKMIRYQPTGLPIGYFDYRLKYIPATSMEKTLPELKEIVENCIFYGSSVSLFTHGVCADGESFMLKNGSDSERGTSSGLEISTFKSFMDYIAVKRDEGSIDIMTYKDFYKSCIG